MSGWLSDGSYEAVPTLCDDGVDGKVKELEEGHSLKPGPVGTRIVRAVLTGPHIRGRIIISKKASVSKEAEYLAKEYARYLLAFADGMPERIQRLTAGRTMAYSKQ